MSNKLNSVKVMFQDSQYNYETNVSAETTKESAEAYFLNTLFDVGVFPRENMQECISIEFTDNNKSNKTDLKKFNDNDTFISVSVYKFPLGNCGGITDNVKSIFIPARNGNYKYSELDKNLVFYPEKRGEEYWALKPVLVDTSLNGPMAGGNLAYCSDSRCERVYHIHDRFEVA
jgi:hypothetical protein